MSAKNAINPDEWKLPPICRKSLVPLALIPGRDLGAMDLKELFAQLQAAAAEQRRLYLAEQDREKERK